MLWKLFCAFLLLRRHVSADSSGYNHVLSATSKMCLGTGLTFTKIDIYVYIHRRVYIRMYL
jgi:hypothetical protein